jgi:hypothetical protein
MKDSTDNTLNGGGIIPEHHDGPTSTIITTIRGDGLNPKSTDTITHLVRLGPKVFLTPHNGLLNDGPNLTNTKI